MTSDDGLLSRLTESWQRYPSRPEFVGLIAEEAVRLAALSGLDPVRILDLDGEGGAWTADLQFRRLNLVVQDRKVLLAATF